MSKSYSINEWCVLRKVSRSYYYVLKSRGEAPRSYKLGSRDRITDEADREWAAQREAVSAGRAA